MFDFQTRGNTDLTSSKLFIFIALRSYLCMWNNVNDIFYSDEHLVKWFHFPSNIILGNDIRNKISPLLWQLVHGFRTVAPVRYLLLSIKSRDVRMKEHPLKSMKIATKMIQVPTKMFLYMLCIEKPWRHYLQFQMLMLMKYYNNTPEKVFQCWNLTFEPRANCRV